LIVCAPTEEKDSEIGHFRNFQPSVTLTLTLDPGHTAYRRVSLIVLVYIQNVVEIGKKRFVDGRTALLGVDLMTDISKGVNRVKIVYGMAEKNSDNKRSIHAVGELSARHAAKAIVCPVYVQHLLLREHY